MTFVTEYWLRMNLPALPRVDQTVQTLSKDKALIMKHRLKTGHLVVRFLIGLLAIGHSLHAHASIDNGAVNDITRAAYLDRQADLRSAVASNDGYAKAYALLRLSQFSFLVAAWL